MLIPNKYSGYRAGIRLYPGGGGGGGGGDGGGSDAGGGGGPNDISDPRSGLGGVFDRTINNIRASTPPQQNLPPAAAVPTFAQPITAATYNQMLTQGKTNDQIRSMQSGLFGSGPSDAQWNSLVAEAGMNSPTGRPLTGSGQFYQPIYQPQYQNYNVTPSMGVAAYGTTPGMGYFMQNPDVQQAYGQNNYGMNPDQFAQTHFQRFGQFEQRAAPTPQYNPYQMTTPFNPYMGGFQTPFSTPQRASSGPIGSIVSRSAGVRGAPAVMARRATGGIADLVGK